MAFHRLYKNAFFLAVSDMAARGANGILALLLANLFGVVVYGRYATALAMCNIIMMVTVLGFEQVLTREGAVNKDRIPENMQLLFAGVGLTCLVAYIVLTFLCIIGVFSNEVLGIALIALVALIAQRFHLPFRHLNIILNRSHQTAIVQCVCVFSLFAAVVASFYLTRSIYVVTVAQAIVYAGITALWVVVNRKYILLQKVAWRRIAEFFKQSFPFAASNIAWIVYFNFDTAMLAAMKTDAVVGVYAAIFRLYSIVYILGYALANTFTPLLFEHFAYDKHEYHKNAFVLIGSMVVLTVPFFILLNLGTENLIVFTLGRDYLVGREVARTFSYAIFFRLTNFALSEILTTSNNQWFRVKLEIILIFTNIILNIFLIPKYGGAGAAVATLIAEIVFCITAFSYCMKERIVSVPGIVKR